MPGPTQVRVEADGGSRGNPGSAGYGAVLKDASTGAVIAEAYASLGIATNNVAEYRGLIAGLELYREHTPDAELEVRMDSKLVIEQMSGRWKVKHPDMRPLAIRARSLAPADTVWTWIPRARNLDADRLANRAMDEAARGSVPRSPDASGSGGSPTADRSGPATLFGNERTRRVEEGEEPDAPPDNVDAPVERSKARQGPLIGWTGMTGVRTQLVFLRHGVTWHTTERRFSGPGGVDPGLTDAGRAQADRAAEAVAALNDSEQIGAIIASPLRRTVETAQPVAERLGLAPILEPGFQEAAFGAWDGLTLDEARDGWPDELDGWLGSTSAPAPGGESVDQVRERVVGAMRRTIEAHAGSTIVVVSHVTPIKLALQLCLRCDWEVTHHMLLAPGSLTTMWFFDGGASVLRHFSVIP